MKTNQSNELARFAWAEYLRANDDCLNSSMFGSGGPAGEMAMCESLLGQINTIFETRYLSGAAVLAMQERYVKAHFVQEIIQSPKQKFIALQERFTKTDSPSEVILGSNHFQRLFNNYTEPPRYYHTLAHLQHGLKQLDSVKWHLDNPVAVELAWWYHDSIYVPGAKDNEEKSLELLLKESKIIGQSAPELSGLILGTKTHTDPQTKDQAYLMDIDLSVMGQSFDQFRIYGDEIRLEYAFVPTPIFVAHRQKFLIEFLARPTIFQTTEFQFRYEPQARANLEQELRYLEQAKDL